MSWKESPSSLSGRKDPRGGETTRRARPTALGNCQDGAGLSLPNGTEVGHQPGRTLSPEEPGVVFSSRGLQISPCESPDSPSASLVLYWADPLCTFI